MLADEILAAAARVTGLSLDILFFARVPPVARADLDWPSSSIGRVDLRVAVAHRGARRRVHAAPPHPADQRQLVRAVLPSADAGVRPRRAGGRRASCAAASGWPSSSSAVAALVHVTTALWFAVLVGVALDGPRSAVAQAGLVDRRRCRSRSLGAALMSPAARASLRADGRPLAAGGVGKDSLFATQWPVWAWIANLGLLALLWWAHRRRGRAGVARPRKPRWSGAPRRWSALFLVTLPPWWRGWPLPVQLQISRVFWLVDFLAIVLLIGVVRRRARRHRRRGGPRRGVGGARRLRHDRRASGARAVRGAPPSFAVGGRDGLARGSRSTRTCSPTPATRGSTARACASPPSATCSRGREGFGDRDLLARRRGPLPRTDGGDRRLRAARLPHARATWPRGTTSTTWSPKPTCRCRSSIATSSSVSTRSEQRSTRERSHGGGAERRRRSSDVQVPEGSGRRRRVSRAPRLRPSDQAAASRCDARAPCLRTGDQANTVNRPSCEATSASASC